MHCTPYPPSWCTLSVLVSLKEAGSDRCALLHFPQSLCSALPPTHRGSCQKLENVECNIDLTVRLVLFSRRHETPSRMRRQKRERHSPLFFARPVSALQCVVIWGNRSPLGRPIECTGALCFLAITRHTGKCAPGGPRPMSKLDLFSPAATFWAQEILWQMERQL